MCLMCCCFSFPLFLSNGLYFLTSFPLTSIMTFGHIFPLMPHLSTVSLFAFIYLLPPTPPSFHLPSPLLHSLSIYLYLHFSLPLEELASVMEPRHFFSTNLLCYRILPSEFCMWHCWVSPLIRYSFWLFEDSVSLAGRVSAEALRMWVFAMI